MGNAGQDTVLVWAIQLPMHTRVSHHAEVDGFNLVKEIVAEGGEVAIGRNAASDAHVVRLILRIGWLQGDFILHLLRSVAVVELQRRAIGWMGAAGGQKEKKWLWRSGERKEKRGGELQT